MGLSLFSRVQTPESLFLLVLKVAKHRKLGSLKQDTPIFHICQERHSNLHLGAAA